jgi:enoyl-CoA hydratase
MDLSATLQQDLRLASRCMQGHDFYEGVRAGLIDRDHAPRWQPGRLEDVSEAVVDAYFTSLGPDELQLASRTEMQAVRT